MTTNAQGRKISQFPASTIIPSDAQLTFVSGGVNYQISAADFFAAMAVTGTIVQTGDPLGTPVLDPQGSVKNIRNLEVGPGILTSISPMNGITVKHNFAADATGVPVLIDTTLAQPTVRSLVAGAGISLAAIGNTIQIVATDIPLSTRTVVINQLGDFPDPVLGVITLEVNTQYLIYNNIDLTTNRIVLPDKCSIEGADSSVITLSYTGTGNMFTAVNAQVRFGRITLSAVNGTILSFTNAAGDKLLQFIDMTISACQNVATIAGASSVVINDCGITFSASGITVTGTVTGVIASSITSFKSLAGIVLDISAATSVFIVGITNTFVQLLAASSTFIKGNGDTNVGYFAGVANVRLLNPGGGTILNGISVSNLRWSFVGNDLLQDSAQSALVSIQNNAVATVISTINVPVLVTGTWIVGPQVHFTGTAAGRITYNGLKSKLTNIDASVTLLAAAGGINTFTAFIQVNGVSVTQQQITADATDPQMLTIQWREELDANDYIELWVSNNDDSDDVIVRHATLRVD